MKRKTLRALRRRKRLQRRKAEEVFTALSGVARYRQVGGESFDGDWDIGRGKMHHVEIKGDVVLCCYRDGCKKRLKEASASQVRRLAELWATNGVWERF